MGVGSDPLTTEESPTPITHKGILMVMSGVIVAGGIAGFMFGGNSFGFGVLFGGVLSFGNYFWLERSTRAIFDQPVMATTGLLAAKYILRYVAIGFVLLAVYKTGLFPVAAVILGLASFALAVVLQGIKNIFSSSL